MGKSSEPMMLSRTTNSNKKTTTTTKKKRGRPSLSDLQNRQQQQQSPNPISPQNPNQIHHLLNHQILPRRARSSRRTATFIDDDDEDDERLRKKVKLVRRLPPSDIIPDSEEEKDWKGTDTQNGTRMLDDGPTTSTTTPLPGDKKLLFLILDKLQKKDTRGVFAEPVDPDELPDYHEVIENPMDFGTVRKKLGGGVYLTLEQLEADIYLICSNAMEYNTPSTMFFRQARSIQELAKKEFDVLRQESGNIEPPPRPRRGRPPGSRNMKKLLENSALDRIGGESSSDATPATRDDDSMKSNGYNLRKGPSLYRFPRNLETSFDFTASSSKSMPMKYVERQYDSEESKRETYNPSFEKCSSSQDPSLQLIFGALDKKLISVGLDLEHSYAQSLAQFAMDLGPLVWRIVSKKLRSILPPGVAFGPGWVGENKTPFTRLSSPLAETPVILSQESFRAESQQHHPSTSGLPDSNKRQPPFSHAEGSRDLNPENDWSSLKGLTTTTIAAAHPGTNGFHLQAGLMPTQKTLPLPFNPGLHNSLEGSRSLSQNPSSIDFQGVNENTEEGVPVPYWQNVSIQERWDLPYPYEAEQNTGGFGLQASDSRSSSLPVGSPPPLDLVLQL